MGATCAPSCSPDSSNGQRDPFRWEYGEDETQRDQEQGTAVVTSIKGVKAETLAKWQHDLKSAQKQFRDPLDRSQPVVLKSMREQQQQISCTYQKPDIFIRDEQSRTKKIFRVFEEYPSGPSEIKVGDSALQYLGIFLCFLSQNPQLLEKIILSNANSYGMHLIAMHPKDTEEYMLIDDYTLCHQKRPLFCQPVKDEYLWPCLIERAWLKYIGHASIIEKKTPLEVFEAFLSHPIAVHEVNENNRLSLTRLLRQSSQQSAKHRCAATSLQAPAHKIGISGRRDFYLLKYLKHNDEHYYHLRSPCDGFEFRGSVQAPSQELLQAFGERFELPEGHIILEEEEFFQQMESVTVMHYNEESSVISQMQIDTPVGEECLIELNFPTQTVASIRFSQTNLLPLTYHLIDLEDHSLVAGEDNQHACFGYQHSNLLPNTYLFLSKGRYLLRLKKKQGPTSQHKTIKADTPVDTLTVTASCEVSFDYLRVQYLSQRLEQFYKYQGSQKLGQTEEAHVDKKAKLAHTAFWVGDLVLVYIESRVKHRQNLEVQFSNRINLECLSHPIGTDFFLMPPLQDNCLIVFEKIDLTEATALGKYIVDSF